MADLQQILGVTFQCPVLLNQALTHSSYVNENPELAPVSNERLEFLGDAILGLIFAENIYRDFPQYSEGEMTQIRAALVKGDTLFRVAKAIDLGSFLVLGKGEEATRGREKSANLESALEAVVAAVYLDQGLSAAKEMVRRLFANEIEKVVGRTGIVDYKSKLQEIIQGKYQRVPTYLLVGVAGPEHERQFTIEVRLNDTVLGRGIGHSKKSAETEAARNALKHLFTQ